MGFHKFTNDCSRQLEALSQGDVMWIALTITVNKLDSLPTDALSRQAAGSRDLEVPLKGHVPTWSPDLGWRIPTA